MRNLAHSSGKFDSCCAAPDNHKGEPPLTSLTAGGSFRFLERHQNLVADRGCVFNALQTWRPGAPFLMSEIGTARAGGDNQVIVGYGCTIPE